MKNLQMPRSYISVSEEELRSISGGGPLGDALDLFFSNLRLDDLFFSGGLISLSFTFVPMLLFKDRLQLRGERLRYHRRPVPFFPRGAGHGAVYLGSAAPGRRERAGSVRSRPETGFLNFPSNIKHSKKRICKILQMRFCFQITFTAPCSRQQALGNIRLNGACKAAALHPPGSRAALQDTLAQRQCHRKPLMPHIGAAVDILA